MKPLPTIFALSGSKDRWLIVAPDTHAVPAGRTFARRQWHAEDGAALTVAAEEVPIVPKLSPPRRCIPRMPRT